MEREFIHSTHLPLGINITTWYHTDARRKYRDSHFHDEVEIIYVNSGEISLDIQQETLKLTADQVALISSKTIHKITPLERGCVFTYIQINLDEHMRDDMLTPLIFNFAQNNADTAYAIERNRGELWDITSKIINEYKHKSTAYQAYIYAYIQMIIAYMTRQKLFRSYNPTIRQKLVKLMPAIEYATNNFSGKLSLEEVASKINVTKYHFCKLFKEATGQTFSAYINYVRIINAEQMLLSSDNTISEIALLCGFNSVQYFNRVFLDKYGYSPFKYKKLKRAVDIQKI